MKNLIPILYLVSFALNLNAQVETDTTFKNGKVIMVQKTVVDSFPKILSPEEAKKYFEGEIVEKDKSLFVVNSFFPFVKEEIIKRTAFKKDSKNAVTDLFGEKKFFWSGTLFFFFILLWNVLRGYSRQKNKNFLITQSILGFFTILIFVLTWLLGKSPLIFVIWWTFTIILFLFFQWVTDSIERFIMILFIIPLVINMAVFYFIPEASMDWGFFYPVEISISSIMGTILLILFSFAVSFWIYRREKAKEKIRNRG